MRPIIRSCLIPMLSLVVVLPAIAGGPIGAVGTQAAKYAANRFPLTYRTDQGNLGSFNNVDATGIATFAFNTWGQLSTATLSFTNLGQLDRDVTSPTDAYITGLDQYSDGIFPVVFDADGSITDSRIGVGASQQIFGFASSFTVNGTDYEEGFVIINGRLSQREGALQTYQEVVTHEIGHMLGISHAQVGLHGDYALMYPSTFTFDDVLDIEPDDAAAMSVLYPAPGYLNSVGSISGKVTDDNGGILSGVNVVFVDSVSGSIYSTVTDYGSGDNGRFVSQPAATGSYRMEGLPPGTYFVRIEPINSYFTGGSGIASYDTPVNTDVWHEWYNGGEESGNMLSDNSNDRVGVKVVAGVVTEGIDIQANDSPTLTTLTEHNGADFQSVTLPLPVGGGTITGFATRYTAPENGSLVGVRFRTLAESVMPTDATLIVSVYRDTDGSLAGIPGEELGSVSVPFSELAADQWNEIWLRGIGQPVNFFQGQKFHIGLRIEGDGILDMVFDDGQNTRNQSSYYLEEAHEWRNFPDGLGGATGVNLHMSAIYSSVPAGVPVPLIDLSPGTVDFGASGVGKVVERDVTVRNIGTADLVVSGVQITGSNSASFSIESGGGNFTLAPGATRDVKVAFSPQSTGSLQALLQFMHNGVGSPSVVSLKGSGRQAVASPLTKLIDFGEKEAGRSFQQDINVLRNIGTDALTITAVEVSGAPFFGNAKTGLPATLSPGSTFGVRLVFAPETVGSFLDTLTIEYDLDSSPLVIELKGTAVHSDTGMNSVATELEFGGLHVDLLPVLGNPVRDRVEAAWTVEGTGRLPVEIAIADMTGSIVARETRTVIGAGTPARESATFDLRNLPSGTYMMTMRGGGHAAVRTFLVIR